MLLLETQPGFGFDSPTIVMLGEASFEVSIHVC